VEPSEKPTDPATGQSSTERVITDFVCTRCSCLCDDLTIRVQSQQVNSVSPACPLAEPWYLTQRGDVKAKSRVRGVEVAEEVAISEAAKLLSEAHAPLIYGLTTCTTDGQRAAVALADRLGARLQVEASATAAASMAAFQTAGASMATLGEIRARADLIVYWGCDPMETHPRHHERYTGGKEPHVVSIQSSSRRDGFADTRMLIDSENHGKSIAVLRSLLQDGGNGQSNHEGLPTEELRHLVERMKNCSYGVIFYGDQIAGGEQDASTLHDLHRLVAELNAYSRFTVRYLNGAPNSTGAANVLAWQTGYANNINFANGFPSYEPGEVELESLLAADAVDLVLFVGSASPPLTEPALRKLREMPCVVVRHAGTEITKNQSVADGNVGVWDAVDPAVEMETGAPGVCADGVYYRMDDVPLSLRRVFEADLYADEDILNAIIEQLRVIE